MICDTCVSSITGSILNVTPLALPACFTTVREEGGGLRIYAIFHTFYRDYIGKDTISINWSPPTSVIQPRLKKEREGICVLQTALNNR